MNERQCKRLAWYSAAVQVALGLLLAAVLSGCASAVAPQGPSQASLRICLDMPMGVPGETNESLAQGFLVAREGHRVCRGVVQGLVQE